MRLWTDEEFRASLSEEERSQYDDLYEQTSSAAFERFGAAVGDLGVSIAEAYPIDQWCARLQGLVVRVRRLRR